MGLILIWIWSAWQLKSGSVTFGELQLKLTLYVRCVPCGWLDLYLSGFEFDPRPLLLAFQLGLSTPPQWSVLPPHSPTLNAEYASCLRYFVKTALVLSCDFCLEHWRTHKGREGWVLLYQKNFFRSYHKFTNKSWSNFILRYFDWALTSKTQPNFSISTKLEIQNLDQT